LREQYPRWGETKLVVLPRDDGLSSSTSTVGRILGPPKERGLPHEAACNNIPARKRPWKCPYAALKQKEYVAKAPGDIMQVDILDVRQLLGVVRPPCL
jgi:hypothetical protein